MITRMLPFIYAVLAFCVISAAADADPWPQYVLTEQTAEVPAEADCVVQQVQPACAVAPMRRGLFPRLRERIQARRAFRRSRRASLFGCGRCFTGRRLRDKLKEPH